MKSAKMLAPIEKRSESFAITRPRKSRSAIERPSSSMRTMSSSMEFCLVWNSTQAMPSPISQTEAPKFSFTFFVVRRRWAMVMARGLVATAFAEPDGMSQ
jgi:hypothetical protein